MKINYQVVLGLLISTLMIVLISSKPKADDLSCLSEAIYFESRSESFIAQLAVANVIIERVRSPSYPNTICEVVHQGRYINGNPIRNKCHFSYWCDGKPERIHNTKAYKKAVDAATLAMNGVYVEPTMGATHYHANYVSPNWSMSPNFQMLGMIGTHIFYFDNTVLK